MVPCNESPYKEIIEQLSISEFWTLLAICSSIKMGGGGGLNDRIDSADEIIQCFRSISDSTLTDAINHFNDVVQK